MSQYLRHAIAPLDVIIPAIKEGWNNPGAKMKYQGWTFNIHSLRLRTFCRCRGNLVCSCCGLKAQYFAVESFKHGNPNSVHINLYGRADGKEILFTHDHTLARSLGGKDNMSNTTVMCSPCNSRKATEESKELERRRKLNENHQSVIQS